MSKAGEHHTHGGLARSTWWPARWALWSLPRSAIGYLIATEAVAILLTVASAATVPADRSDVARLAVLAVCAVGYAEGTRRLERTRQRYAGMLHHDVNGAWIVPAALLAPPYLATALALAIFLHTRLRVLRLVPYRHLFSLATLVLAVNAVAAVRALEGTAGSLASPAGVGVLAAALAGYFLVNTTLVGVGIAFATRRPLGPQVIGGWDGNLLDIATVCLGGLASLALTAQPLLVALTLPTLFVLQRNVLIQQLEHAARTDAKTGLLNAVAWHETASQELRRARRERTSLGVVMVDLDHFKRVNDTHGHLAGDEVLRAFAQVLAGEVREYDVAGRFGGEEFAVCLPGSAWDETIRAADRIRLRVTEMAVLHGEQQITGLTASIGIAVHPHHGDGMEELLAAADAALYEAKNAGRNRVRIRTHNPADPL